MVILCIWIFVVLPLTLVGAVIGRNVAGTPDHPCRISPIPRPIPEKKWFMEYYGFDIIIVGLWSRISQPDATPRAPHDVLYVVPTLIGCGAQC